MNLKEQKDYDLAVKKISAILSHKELPIIAAPASLYTLNDKSNKWLYSNLNGHLTLIGDYLQRRLVLKLYDFHTFELLFQITLFDDFQNYYTSLTPLFHSLELKKGFLGFKFNNTKLSADFLKLINMYNKEFQEMLFSNEPTNDTKFLSPEFLKAYRSKFKLSKPDISELKKNINPITNSIELCKPMYFYFLSCFSFDSMTKKFSLTNNLPDELGTMLNRIGYKKSYLHNDEMSLILFKSFIDNFDKNLIRNQQRISKLVKIENSLVDKAAEDEIVELESKKRHSCLIFNNANAPRRSLIINDKSLLHSLQFSNNSNISGNSSDKTNSVFNFSDDKRKSCVPSIPTNFKIPSIPKIPIMNIKIPEIPKLETIPEIVKNEDGNKDNNENKANDNEQNGLDDVNEVKINNNATIEPIEEFSLQKELLKVKLTKANNENTAKPDANSKNIKSLNDVEYELKRQLQMRAQIMSNAKSDDEDSEESDW